MNDFYIHSRLLNQLFFLCRSFIRSDVVMLVFFGIIIASFAIPESNGQDPCSTPSGTQGVCISLSECGPLLDLLKQSETSSPTSTEILRKSVCGLRRNTPKVCCDLESTVGTTTTLTSIPNRNLGFIPDPPDVTNHPKLGLINQDFCGRITEPKIILGNKTSVLEFPWMALIGYNYNKTFTTFLCGGTLINKRYVLTAAHCVTGLENGLELSGVRIGDHDITKQIDCDEENGMPTVCADKYQNFFFESLHPHQEYRPPKFDNDIALIRLDGDADFRYQNVRPICLPVGKSMALKSKKVLVTGWGITERGHRSPDLLKVRLELAPDDECAEIWRRSNGVDLTYRQFCAGGKNGMDACGGDSGGPLQYPAFLNNTPKYVQYGIVSLGTRACAIDGYPGVYTQTVHYMDWILDTMVE